MVNAIDAGTCEFCFIDLDIGSHRQKLATAAAFVDATDSRYGFSSKDLRYLGGSEIARIPELITTDHEWSKPNTDCGGIETRAPDCGSRIVVKLYWDVAPLACENFATLCSNGSLLPTKQNGGKVKPAPIGESGKPLTYRGSTVHRVIPGFVIQGGDFVFGNGSGGESIYNGKKFKDDRAGLGLKHDRRGVLSMGNSGKNSNSSQFFFTFAEAPQCDGKHVVFGEVVSGWEVLTSVETFGSSSGDPTRPITITDCGIYTPFAIPACGYWYDQPDEESYSGVSPIFMVRPRIAIVGPSSAVVQRFQTALKTHASCTHTISTEELDDENAQVAHIKELLGAFAIDAVLVAPASKAIVAKIALPTSWDQHKIDDNQISSGDVIMVAKPVEALSSLHTKTWLSKYQSHWRLDGSMA